MTRGVCWITAIAVSLVAQAGVAQAGVAQAGTAAGAEVCRFSGATDHSGHVAITASVSKTGDFTTVDVGVTFNATTMFVVPIRYLVQEISRWRNRELESVAVNTRYLVSDQVVRQQWDEFQRGSGGLRAYRVQAKTLDDFRRRHPGFVQHWDPATFGQPWLDDYAAASPERRADLDLQSKDLPGGVLPANLRSPLAMAFYWIRWLPPNGQNVTVFLPGFKADRLLDLAVTGSPGTGRRGAADTAWRAPLHYPALKENPVSQATAMTAADGHLRQLAFKAYQPSGSAEGTVYAEGCEGTAGPGG